MLHYLLLIFLGNLLDARELPEEIVFDTQEIGTLTSICDFMRTEAFLNEIPTLTINNADTRDLFKTLATLLYVQTVAHRSAQQKKLKEISVRYKNRQTESSSTNMQHYHSALHSIQRETDTFCTGMCQSISQLYGAFKIPYIPSSASSPHTHSPI